MKELEKVMIEDVEYSYDPEKEYIKDGHAFCKVCHERKDGKVMEFFDNKMIFKIVFTFFKSFGIGTYAIAYLPSSLSFDSSSKCSYTEPISS